MSVREFDIIDRYFSDLTPSQAHVSRGIGDDAAVIDIPNDQQLLVSVDTMVEGRHFLSSATAFDIAYKSLAVNISDIAAMGGEPQWATLALTLPYIDPDWLGSFAEGFAQIAAQYGICLVGGDTTEGPLSVTVQIMGTIDKGKSVLRSGAQAGDLVYVSGWLGAAGLACQSLLGNTANQSVSAACYERLHRPEPRLELGKCLGGLATAAIDISDGLASDLGHILNASELAAEIELDKLPVCEDVDKLDDKKLAWQLATSAGDDYELCFTLPMEKQAQLDKHIKSLAYPVSCIGKIVKGKGISWFQGNGREVKLDAEGFQHF
jgi:thiamine-monophosphate kinase